MYYKMSIVLLVVALASIEGMIEYGNYILNQSAKVATDIAYEEIEQVENDRCLTRNEKMELKNRIVNESGFSDVVINGTTNKVERGQVVAISIDLMESNLYGARTLYKEIYLKGIAK